MAGRLDCLLLEVTIPLYGVGPEKHIVSKAGAIDIVGDGLLTIDFQLLFGLCRDILVNVLAGVTTPIFIRARYRPDFCFVAIYITFLKTTIRRGRMVVCVT